MHLPRWLRGIAQPLRSAVAGAIGLAGVGAIYGIVESISDYPLDSWFGVTLYVAMLGAVAGFVLGAIAGATILVCGQASRLCRERRSRSE